LDEAGTLASTIAMSSGTLDADESLTLSGALTQSGNITIDVADNKTLTYSGAALNLGANTLTLIGGGTLSNTNALVLNHANSLLSLAGILVIGDVDGTTASNPSGKGIKVTSSATLGDYDLSAVSYLDIAANKTLAGQLNLQSNGELNISGLGRYTGDIALAGGKFSATDSQVLSGTLSITADSELRVSENYILTLSQTGGLSLGANTLTLSGGGSLVSGGLTLDNASSKLLLNSITVDSVSTSLASLGLDVDANSTVTSLTVGHTTPVSIASSRTLSGAITVTAGSIKLSEAGTLASTISMSGGTLDADESLTLSGALTQSGNITIDVADNKTLTYSGDEISLGAYTLTMSGGGRFSNSNALELNNASSKLLLSSITVDRVSTSSNSLGLDVDNNSTVTSLTVAHTTPVSIAGSKILSGAITVTAGSIKLDETGELASTISMSGGELDADNSSTLSGTLTQAGNITIDVADDKTLTYSGDEISLGAYTLTLSGGGTLVSGGLNLNNASSKLLLNSITVDNVSTTSDSLGLDVDNDSTVSSLSVAHITPVSIASGSSLSGGITVTAGSLKLTEAGELASTISMSGGDLDADESLTISGAVTQAGNATIDVASGKTITFDNGTISTENYQMTIEGAGTVAFPSGTTWTAQNDPPASGTGQSLLNAVTYGNGTFVTVGVNGVIITSFDGISWTKRASGNQIKSTDIASVRNTGGDLEIRSTGHGLDVGDVIRFTTTGTLPTGLALSTDYFVVAVPINNSFFVSATESGTPIVYTDGGTGTHSWQIAIALGSTGNYQLATHDFANGVVTDSSGNVYVTGGTKGGLDGNTSAGNTDLFVVKYNSSGTKQ